MVRQATDTAVSASISTPVWPDTLTSEVTRTPGRPAARARARATRRHPGAGLARHPDFGGDPHARQALVEGAIDRNLGEQERMAQRDQLVRALRRHDAGEARGAEHIPLLRVPAQDDLDRFGRHYDE